MALKRILVKSASGDNQVALWERHPEHPGGEVFVTGERVVEVAKTPAVLVRLKRNILVEVPRRAKARKQDEK